MIIPRNLGTFAHVAVRGIGRAQKKGRARSGGNEANRRGQIGCPSYHQRGTYIFAPDEGSVKARTEKGPARGEARYSREDLDVPARYRGDPAGY